MQSQPFCLPLQGEPGGPGRQGYSGKRGDRVCHQPTNDVSQYFMSGSILLQGPPGRAGDDGFPGSRGFHVSSV